MALDDFEFKKLQDMVYTDPMVEVKVDQKGDLWIDKQLICHGFAQKLGSLALKVEIAILRAIDNAESRTREQLKKR